MAFRCARATHRSPLMVIVGAAVLASTCTRGPAPPTSASPIGSVDPTVTFSRAPLGSAAGDSVEALLGDCLAGRGILACWPPDPPRGLTGPDGRAAPQSPTGLTAVVANGAVTLSWTAPAGGDPPTTYVIQGGTVSGASNLANLPTGNVLTTFTSPPVPPGLYFVRVLARNGADDSGVSNEVSFTILGEPSEPLAPPVLSFTLQGNVATFTWTTPNGGGIVGYRLSAGDAPGLSNWRVVDLPPVNTLTPDPLPSGAYHVRVAARGAAGEVGPDSNEVVVRPVSPLPNARYRVLFEADWSAQTHPNDFPANPHVSRLIGATHGPDVVFWQPGAPASAGIQNMAERGSTSPFDAEIRQAQAAGTAENLFIGGGLNPSPGVASAEFEISQNYPLVTLVSMIAPSPDWFVGVRNLSMLNGDWRDEVVVELPPWDAGTDSGVTFDSIDDPTVPRGVIRLLDGSPVAIGGQVPSFGRFIFRRIQ